MIHCFICIHLKTTKALCMHQNLLYLDLFNFLLACLNWNLYNLWLFLLILRKKHCKSILLFFVPAVRDLVVSGLVLKYYCCIIDWYLDIALLVILFFHIWNSLNQKFMFSFYFFIRCRIVTNKCMIYSSDRFSFPSDKFSFCLLDQEVEEQIITSLTSRLKF